MPSKKPPHRTPSGRGPLASLSPSFPPSMNMDRVPKTYQAIRDTHTRPGFEFFHKKQMK